MKTILCAEFNHETNRYAKGVSGEKEYKSRRYLWNAEDIRRRPEGTKSEMGCAGPGAGV